MSKIGAASAAMRPIEDFTKFSKHDEVKNFQNEYIGGGGTRDGFHQQILGYFKDNYKAPAQRSSTGKPQGVMETRGLIGAQDTTPNQLVQSLQDRQSLYDGDPTVKQKVLGV